MKRLAIVALAVLFVSTLSVAMAETEAIRLSGAMTVMAAYEENTVTAIGSRGMDNRVEQLVQLNVDADMTDNVSAHIGLEATGFWAGLNTGASAAVDGQAAALAIDEAYIKVEELFVPEVTMVAGVMTVEYQLRDDGNAMFLSIPEMGAWKGTYNHEDTLYVDLIIGKFDETRNVNNENDMDLYALAIEYYLVDDRGKVQFIIFNIADEDDDWSLTEYSLGVTYKGIENLDIFAQLGGQGGEVATADAQQMAFNVGAEYVWANVNRRPYLGLSWQYFGGDDDAGDVNWQNFGDVDETLVLEADRELRDHNLRRGKLLTNNYQAIRLVGGCDIDEKTDLAAEIAFVSKANKDAAVGGATGIGGAADQSIGTEIDLTVTHQFTEDLTVSAALGYVISGDAIDDTSGEQDALIGFFCTAALDF